MKGRRGSGSDTFCSHPHDKVQELKLKQGVFQQDCSLHNHLSLKAQETLVAANVSCIFGYLMK